MTALGAAGAVVRDADGVRLVFDRVPPTDDFPTLADRYPADPGHQA